MFKQILFSTDGLIILIVTVIIISMKYWLYRWIKNKMSSSQ